MCILLCESKMFSEYDTCIFVFLYFTGYTSVTNGTSLTRTSRQNCHVVWRGIVWLCLITPSSSWEVRYKPELISQTIFEYPSVFWYITHRDLFHMLSSCILHYAVIYDILHIRYLYFFLLRCYISVFWPIKLYHLVQTWTVA